jgi:hypothetical protein
MFDIFHIDEASSWMNFVCDYVESLSMEYYPRQKLRPGTERFMSAYLPLVTLS